MDNDDKPLTLVEAFRDLLRARRPGPLADEIDSYSRLHYRADGSDRDPDDREAAVAAATLIRDAIADYRLPVEARHGPKGARQPVHRADQRLGEVNIFESPELRFYSKSGSLEVDEGLSFYGCTVRQGDVVALRDAQQPPTLETDAAPSPSAPEAQSETPPPPAAQPDEAVSGRPTASRRRRNQGGGPQTLRARVVLKRMYPERYPTEDEVSGVDLYDRFAEEYKKVEGKANPPSKWGMPSRRVVMREVGRAG
jgi:hypothetical protein